MHQRTYLRRYVQRSRIWTKPTVEKFKFPVPTQRDQSLLFDSTVGEEWELKCGRYASLLVTNT